MFTGEILRDKGVCMPFYDEKTNKLLVLYFVDCLRMKYDCLYFRKPFAPFYAVKCGISSCDMRHFTSSFITIGLMVYVKMQHHHIGTTRRKRGVNGVETML